MTDPRPQLDASPLRRSLSLPAISLYGIGTVLGAGIYVLVGEVAGEAGLLAPLSFLLASLVAALTGLSFAEWTSRRPESAGEAVFVREGLGSDRLATLVGLAVALTGIVSAGAIAVGFAGYFQVFFAVPDAVATGGLVIALGLLAAWGIDESAGAAVVMTIIEIGGLLLVLWVGREHLAALPSHAGDLFVPTSPGAAGGVFVGAFVSFYAFIGFEDLVNSAEEVKDPERNLPLALLITLITATALYLLVATTCVLALPLEELSASDRPLAEVYARATGREPLLISGISTIAVANGALVNMIMASRVLYGLSRRGWLPDGFGRVNARTRTPLLATAVITLLVLALAVSFPLSTLAQVTSLIILAVFGLVNVALWRVKGRSTHDGFTVPRWVPVAALATIVALLGYRSWALVAG